MVESSQKFVAFSGYMNFNIREKSMHSYTVSFHVLLYIYILYILNIYTTEKARRSCERLRDSYL